MNQLIEAFVLGSSAILTNVCMLPLYPGLIAYMAGSAGDARRIGRWVGLLVLAGVLTMMLALGLLLYLARQSFAAVLPVLLPVVYAVVIVLGLLLLTGRSPFARLARVNAPVLANRYASAFVYGLLLGPMTLPCTGPLITSAFVLGAGDAAMLADGLAYFLAFGLGFGWPLVVLPFIAQSAQRVFTRWLTAHHVLLSRVSGLLLIGIGLLGLIVDVAPNL